MLRASSSFRRFWFGQAASNLGDAFAFVAMPLLVLHTTGSVAGMGTVTACAAAGQLCATPFSGLVVDRVHRRRLMIACDLARLVLYGSVPVLASRGELRLGVLYAVAFLTSAASNVFLVAYMAAVANLVEPHEVPSANGRLQATQALTYVLGSALAGGVASRFGAAWAMGFDALSFGVSATMLAFVRFRRDRAERVHDTNQGSLHELAEGLRYLVREPGLRAVTLFQTSVALLGSVGVGAAVIDIVVYRLKVDFAETSSLVGTSLALSSLGAVLGAILAGRLGRRIGLGVVCAAGTGFQGLGLLLGGVGQSAVFTVLAGMLWSGGLTFRAVAVTSLRQTLTPDALLGRVVSVGWLLIFSASALGAVVVTRLAAGIGSASAMSAVGLALLGVAAAGALSPLRRAG
jgi:predicted MFS family arabinose efflux permease